MRTAAVKTTESGRRSFMSLGDHLKPQGIGYKEGVKTEVPKKLYYGKLGDILSNDRYSMLATHIMDGGEQPISLIEYGLDRSSEAAYIKILNTGKIYFERKREIHEK